MKLPAGLALPTDVSPKAVARLLGGLVVLVALVAVVGAVLREPIVAFSAGLVAEYGLIGLFAGVFALDQTPGLGFQPVVFLAYTGGIAPMPLLLVAWLASLSASAAVYAVGRAFRGRPSLVALLLRWRIGHWIQAYGARAIAVAALAPVPFCLATFGAGVMGIPLRDLLLGASVRVVKIGLMLAAVAAGWGLGT